MDLPACSVQKGAHRPAPYGRHGFAVVRDSRVLNAGIIQQGDRQVQDVRADGRDLARLDAARKTEYGGCAYPPFGRETLEITQRRAADVRPSCPQPGI